MPAKKKSEDSCRLRVDPVLVDKFRRLQGGINEVGTKIIRDLGLRYIYDKKRGTFDLIGPDTEILSLAIETLRFWVEDDEFPDTGITCQVGYPNRRIIVWRFHGDYAKKFDHLFSIDIAKLKLVTSVNIKAVPNKRNPEYVELYCHFSVYHQVKGDVAKIANELSRIFQDDFFIPKSDFLKARDFARSKINDENVLYALKEYPDNKVRVWLFARNHLDILRARKEWVAHVGVIARDNEFTETVKKDGSIRSASFFGHPASALGSDTSEPIPRIENTQGEYEQRHVDTMDKHKMSLTLRQIMPQHKLKPRKNKKISPRTGPEYDNSNFPRPSNFVYPVNVLPEKSEDNSVTVENHSSHNPFDNNALIGDVEDETIFQHGSLGSVARWIREDDTNTHKSRGSHLYSNNRIYIHQQVSNGREIQANLDQVQPTTGTSVIHPDKNLVVKERYNPINQAKSVLTNDNDPNKIRTVRKGNQKIRPGDKSGKKPAKINASIRQKRPTLQANKPATTVRYNINVNGLDIYMYKQDITKVTNMDAIANVVASNLKTGGLIATNVFTEAGKQVTDELNVHVSLYGEAKTSDSVVTSAGRLPSLGIVHVVSPIWKEYTVWEDCASDLHIALYNALKTAETHKYRKIAIPTIGSEPYFGVPRDLVAEVYVKALVDYSLGMGPMYPVLEIHLVDMDVNMLTYIKDAYESWASTPGMEDMTQNLNRGSENIMRNPQDVGNRSESAVSLKALPSHRSENMVTFNGQSYTTEGEQIWTFNVLKKLSVHVYTGSILKLQNIDAIMCAVDVNMKGNLAKQVHVLGGKRYGSSLKKARGNRTLVEGEVLVCDGGDLGVRNVLHSVIATPIYVASQKNISRLDSINTQIFYTANQNGIKSLAMPLIGTGRLRERFEVEQCSLQLIDNIIEMCLGIGQKLKLKDLHLVNTNNIMTQYLTQALRTRAHTKLRVETEPHVPSRQEVLSKAEAIRRTPELVRKFSAKSSMTQLSDGETLKTKESKIEATNTADEVLNQHDLVVEKSDNASNRKNGKKVATGDANVVQGNTDVGDKHNDKKKAPYLSMKTLQQHNHFVQDAWLHLMDEEANDEFKSKETRYKQSNTARQNQSDHHNKSEVIKKAQDYLQETKLSKTKRSVKTKSRRIIQRSSDYISQKSQTESYKTLFDKRRKYSEISQREELIKLRKSQSSDDIWKNENADKVLESLKKEKRNVMERNMMLGEKEQGAKYERDYDYSNNIQISTREIKGKFKAHNEHDINFKLTDRAENEHVNGHKTGNFGNKTERLIRSKSDRQANIRVTPLNIRRKNERYLIDAEREDMYMMDMDYLVKEQDRMGRDKVNDLLEETPVNTHRQNYGTSDNIQTARQTSRTEEVSEAQLTLPSMSKSMEANYQVNDQRQFNEQHKGNYEPDLRDDEKHTFGGVTEKKTSKVKMATNVPHTEETIEQSNYNPSQVEVNDEIGHKDATSKYNSVDKYKDSSRDDAIKRNKTYTGNKSVKTSKSYIYKNKPTVTFSDIHQIKRNKEQGRAEYIQAYTKTPRRSPEPNDQRKIVEWKNETKMTKAALDRYNNRRSRAVRAPKPEDVTIRDQLKLQIEILDKQGENKTENSAEIEKEKKKIKRFWEVVGKDNIDEAEMYGEDSTNEKMLIAKVTKERVMSAKTTGSKQSKQSVITHSVGNYNLTLAVAD